MTARDLCPGLEKQPLPSQLQEVLRRARACHANVEIIPDPRLIDKLGDYLDLGIEIADKLAGAGPSSCHQEDATQPASAPSKPHLSRCYTCTIDCSRLEWCPR